MLRELLGYDSTNIYRVEEGYTHEGMIKAMNLTTKMAIDQEIESRRKKVQEEREVIVFKN